MENEAWWVSTKEFLPAIDERVLVPNCVYRGFCPEMTPCGFWDAFSKDLTKEGIIDWRARYGRYNEKFGVEA